MAKKSAKDEGTWKNDFYRELRKKSIQRGRPMPSRNPAVSYRPLPRVITGH